MPDSKNNVLLLTHMAVSYTHLHVTDSMLNVVFSVIRFSHSFFAFSVLDTNFSSNSVFSFPIFYVFRVSNFAAVSNRTEGLHLSCRMV